MKHRFDVTLMLLSIFIFAQLFGLLVINSYVDVEATEVTGNITYKDGVHIVIPEIVLENSFALYIRKLYLEKTNFLS